MSNVISYCMVVCPGYMNFKTGAKKNESKKENAYRTAQVVSKVEESLWKLRTSCLLSVAINMYLWSFLCFHILLLYAELL